MELGPSLTSDVEDTEMWDDSSERLPTPSVSSNGQNLSSPEETNEIANYGPQSKKTVEPAFHGS